MVAMQLKRQLFSLQFFTLKLNAKRSCPPSTAALHPFFRLINPPAVRGMACQAVKKAVSKTDGLLKAGGAEETRTLDPHTASVML